MTTDDLRPRRSVLYMPGANARALEKAQTLAADGATMAGVDVGRLAGVSLGAVFLGAMTYIGNGPNFMVKAIAEQSGVKMPSFFGYVLYSLGVLLPVFAVMSLLFL